MEGVPMSIAGNSESDHRYHLHDLRRLPDDVAEQLRGDEKKVDDHAPDRRRFLRAVGAAGAGVVMFAGTPSGVLARGRKYGAASEEEVTANEDLMREHGVLKRALLIYREGIRRLGASEEFPPDVLADTAQLIRRFVEEYHEKQEEQYVFPRFEKAGKHTELVRTLRLQHERGRQRTEAILQIASGLATKGADDRARLAEHMKAFIRMYEPHEAREDTVLFPAVHELVSSNEYDSFGEAMERNERRTFGGDGFDMAVDRVTELEKKFGIFDLAQFTPAALGPAPS
jgi:hemerythrin-like domain-containing protein